MKKSISYFFIVVLLGLPMLGCNTMKGAGQDIQKAGEELEDAADK